MKNISIRKNINLNNCERTLNDNKFFSLKITDSLYKKDIEKFLDFLSSHFL